MATDERTGGLLPRRPDSRLGRFFADVAGAVGGRLRGDGAPARIRARTAARLGLPAEPAEPEETIDPDRLRVGVSAACSAAEALSDLVDERTVDVDPSVDEEAFFTTSEGDPTLTTRYDLEKAVPVWKKTGFEEVERYWVNEPHAFVVVFHARRENERKYYLVEPHLTEREAELCEFLTARLRASLDYDRGGSSTETHDERARVIERAARRLLDRYGLRASGPSAPLSVERIPTLFGDSPPDDADRADPAGPSVRPEPAMLEDEDATLSEYQVRKLVYYLVRDFVGYERIDAILHDVNVEDISCDGYDSPVFVYHSEHENLITNVGHGRDELDDFVIKLAQRSGKAISKRRPQVDATIPDGSRAQLTLGREVADRGTNYTIRQFRDVPFTPVDLINWRTFSLDQMAYCWLAIENGRSMLFAGGTASGKTTSLNAMSLFVPSNAKVVSIEDTREVELPHRNWVASVTRPTLSASERGDIDEFDLLEAALRQRPDYIVMGEVRGEEGRTLFQITSTGHTTYTTFHAGTVDEVIKRFTNDPIDVSKTLFTSLDVVSVQAQTRIGGRKVRRNKTITEVTGYDPGADEIHTNDVYEWRADEDAFESVGSSSVMEAVSTDRGWTSEELEAELEKRRVVLAYLVREGLVTYSQVAATIQAFISDPEMTLSLVANGTLAEHLDHLRRIENVDVDIDPETEALVPRPSPDDEAVDRAETILAEAEEGLLDRYRDRSGVDAALDALASGESASDAAQVPTDGD